MLINKEVSDRLSTFKIDWMKENVWNTYTWIYIYHLKFLQIFVGIGIIYHREKELRFIRSL